MVSVCDVPIRSTQSHLDVESGGTSVQGARRYNNEDCFYADDRTGVFIVADGVGGHSAGQVASRMAVRHLGKDADQISSHRDQRAVHSRLDRLAACDDPWKRESLQTVTTAPRSGQEIRLRLHAAFRAAHMAICDRQREDVALNGMSTTACIAIVDNSTLHVAHVGDSRVLHISDNRVSCLTRDHSFVELMRQAGKITDEEVTTHPFRNVLVKFLGGPATQGDVAAPDVTSVQLSPGDRIVLATDGVTDHIDQTRLADIVNNACDPDEAAATIVSTAVTNRSTDDATCVVVFVEDNHNGI